MNYQELKNVELKNNIYLLSGDAYLIINAKNMIAKKLGVDEINMSEFNDENFDALTAINACNQFSFFNEKRIVFITDLQKELRSDQKNLFISYERSPNPDCILLIENNHGFFDFLKTAEKIDCVPSENFVHEFIKLEFEKLGKKIGIFEIKKLSTYCLNNITRLNLEIKKISDFLNEEAIVTSEVIENLVVKDTELKVFDLTIALSNKNIQQAQELLYNMIKAEEPPIKILGLISGHFRRMFFAKINKGTSSDLAKLLNCKEYAISKAKNQAEKFSATQLKDIQNLILETDYNIKNGVFSQENALYYLIYKICN